jgi:hypothetical protein
MRSILSLLLLAGLATPALAVDGVLEINQTCAVQMGCFVGDSPGFPVLILTSGSYRLTSNLLVPESKDGISIDARNVSVDLNGFEIRGPATCTEGPPVNCTGSSNSGVYAEAEGVSVRNGSIMGIGYCVNAGAQADVTGLRVAQCSEIGIKVGRGSVVSGNQVYISGDYGIDASGFGSRVATTGSRPMAQAALSQETRFIRAGATELNRMEARRLRGIPSPRVRVTGSIFQTLH